MKHRLNILIFAVLVTLISLFLKDEWYFIPLLLIAGLIFLTVLSLGVLFMQFNYFLKSTTKLKNDKVLLTFDDGPDPETTPLILDILKAHEIKAVFFVVGSKLEQHPAIGKRIHEEGHLVGNHSFTHNHFMSLFSKKKLRSEIGKTQAVIAEITGLPSRIFRPPIGYTNPKYAAVLREQKMKCIGWTLRSYDSVYKDRNALISRLVSNVKNGQIVLLHDNLKVTAESLNDFILEAKRNGIIFASSADIKTILDE